MALSEDKPRETEDFPRYSYQVLASTTIYSGGLVAIDATGYAIPAELTAGVKVVGICRKQADNSGGTDGAIDVLVHAGLSTWLTNDSTNAVDQADVGGVCYVFDDDTVRDYVGAGVNVPVGTVQKIDATKGVKVWIGFPQDAVGAITGNLDVSGNLSAGGTFGVTGVSTLASAVVIGAATVGTTLGVTGIATFTAEADFDGGLALAAGQSITGDGAMTVEADAAATLTLDGVAVAVTPAATFAANVDLDAGATIATGQTIAGDAELALVAAAGSDLTLTNTVGAGDTIVVLGDAVGAQKLSVTDSAATEQFRVSSDGLVETPTGAVGSGIVNRYEEIAAAAGTVSSAELDTAFGTVPDGFVGAVRDTANAAFWLVARLNSTWYELNAALTTV